MDIITTGRIVPQMSPRHKGKTIPARHGEEGQGDRRRPASLKVRLAGRSWIPPEEYKPQDGTRPLLDRAHPLRGGDGIAFDLAVPPHGVAALEVRAYSEAKARATSRCVARAIGP